MTSYKNIMEKIEQEHQKFVNKSNLYVEKAIKPEIIMPEISMEDIKREELVNKPNHYAKHKIEPVTFIMENDLDFATGNIIKYAVRAGHKTYEGMTAEESAITDLEKVRRYAEMKINLIKGEEVL